MDVPQEHMDIVLYHLRFTAMSPRSLFGGEHCSALLLSVSDTLLTRSATHMQPVRIRLRCGTNHNAVMSHSQGEMNVKLEDTAPSRLY